MCINEELISQLMNAFLNEPIKTLERFQQEYLHSQDPILLYYWGVALAEMGRFDDAIKKLKQYHHHYPNDPRPLYVWGAVLSELGRPIEAQEQFEKADMLLLLNG